MLAGAATASSPPDPSAVAPASGSPGLALAAYCALTLLAMLAFAVQSAIAGLGRIESEAEEPPRWRGLPDPSDAAAMSLFESQVRCSGILLRIAALLFAASAGAQAGFGIPGVLAGSLMGLAAHFVLLEGAARSLALSHVGGTLAWAGPPARVLAMPFAPLAALSVHPASTPRRHEGDDTYDLLRARELSLLPHVEGVDRVYEEEAVEMMDSVRAFRDKRVREAMTPRVEVDGIERGASRDEVVAMLRRTDYSRVLVYRGNLDQVEGILLAKEVLLNPSRDPFSLMRQPVFVDAEERLPEVLAQLRSRNSHLAVVVDEFGGTCGIVTLHDLFEQLIGEHIEDEEDEEELWIEERAGGSALLSGRVELWEVNEELELDLDESVARTVGGFLMYRFGRLPDEGDRWTVDKGHLTVVRMDGNRIEQVLFEPDPSARESVNGSADAKGAAAP